MDKIKLGSTELNVSPISLGTAQYGLLVAEAEAFGQMDRYLELGGNFIDTALIYNDWEPGGKARSEKIIGRYLKARGNRADIVLSTKGGHPPFDNMRAGRCDAASIKADLQESLEHLQTDYIDLYFLHRDDVRRPAGDIVDTMEGLRQQGLIKHYGFSNWQLRRAREAAAYALKKGVPGFECNQIRWSLARVNAEMQEDKTLVVMDSPYYFHHARTGMALMAYTSLANGYFTKRMQGGERWKALHPLLENAENDRIFDILRAQQEAGGPDANAQALRWFMEKPFAAVPIVSFSAIPQLEAAMAAFEGPRLPLLDGLPMV